MSSLDLYLLRAYLDGDLDQAEAEAFEHVLLTRPDLAELVEADCALRIGLASTEAPSGEASVDQSESAGATHTAAATPSFPVSRVSHRRSRLPWLAAAASLVLALGFGAGRLGQQAPSTRIEAGTLAYIDKLRDISVNPELQLPASGALIMLVPIAALEPCEAQIDIQQAGTETLSTRAQPDVFGYVSLVLPHDALRPGEAVVEARCAGALVARYELRVVNR